MQDKPLAFICSPFRGDLEANAEMAREYSRRVYEAGYTPLAPHLLFPQFLSEHDPAEREAGIQMGMELLGRCRLLVISGDAVTEGMGREIACARWLRVPVVPLDEVERAPHAAKPSHNHQPKRSAPEL